MLVSEPIFLHRRCFLALKAVREPTTRMIRIESRVEAADHKVGPVASKARLRASILHVPGVSNYEYTCLLVH